MAKTKSAFVCNDCGADYRKWQGQCSACNAWNTLSEVRIPGATRGQCKKREAALLAQRHASKNCLTSTWLTYRASARALQSSIVYWVVASSGSAILIGGHPGAGKSTLLLQTLCALAARAPALYVTGEESPQQVAMRAKRLGLETDSLQLMAETDVDAILAAANEHKPKIMVVDSIQVVHSDALTSAPGSVAQVRDCAALLTRYAKQTGTVLILVGHVTKDGSLAGPKVLEHMIDCSVLLEGEQDSRYRTLRGQKNRFGAVNELGVFAMTDGGLKEVLNPSAIFLERADTPAPGTVVVVVWEGTRPFWLKFRRLWTQVIWVTRGVLPLALSRTGWPCCWRCYIVMWVYTWAIRCLR